MICHPKGQSGFTLIEMILVIGVLGILMSLGSYLFVATDNNKYYAETCANNIYSTIKNYQYSALVGKQLDGGITPDSYSVKIDNINQEIILGYISGSTTYNYQTIDLNDADPQWLCAKEGSYTISLSGDFHTLDINFVKNLTTTQGAAITIEKEKDGFIEKIYQMTITIIQNEVDNINYKEISQIRIDTRSQNITYHSCFIFARATGICQQWEQ